MFRTRYRYDKTPGFESVKPSVTQQQFKQEADINYIVKSYGTDGIYRGVNPPDSSRKPFFGDFTGLPETTQEAYNFILDAKARFDQLPLPIRQRFNFDAGAFLDFCEDPNNLDELVRMGLAIKTGPADSTQNNDSNNAHEDTNPEKDGSSSSDDA